MAYLTPAQIRDRHPDLPSSKYSDQLLTDLEEEFRTKLERFRGVAYSPTTSVEHHTIRCGARKILTGRRLVTSVTSLVIDGTAYTGGFKSAGLAAGLLEAREPLPGGEGVLTIVHGFASTPAAVKRACGLYVWREAKAQANPNTGNSYLTTNPDLGIVERSSTASWTGDRPTGWLDVDRIVIGLEDFRSDP